MRFFEWNINLASNITGSAKIPNFVGDEIVNCNADFFALTEFNKTENYFSFIEEYIKSKGYDYIITNNHEYKQNDVLLCWKRDLYDLIEIMDEIVTNGNNNIPNFAYVKLKRKSDGGEFVFAGARITLMDYSKRKEQFEFILNKLKPFDKVILVGDFNCLRRGTNEMNYNLRVMNDLCKIHDFELYTPNGQSIFQEQAKNTEFEFAEDNVVARGIIISDYYYNRDFATKYSDIYINGKNFSIYDSRLRKNIWNIVIGSGIPDHAILIGEVDIEKE